MMADEQPVVTSTGFWNMGLYYDSDPAASKAARLRASTLRGMYRNFEASTLFEAAAILRRYGYEQMSCDLRRAARQHLGQDCPDPSPDNARHLYATPHGIGECWICGGPPEDPRHAGDGHDATSTRY